MNVTDIQRFCMHDGPGVRTTVFLKGCPLRCKWCHNPETQRVEPEILFYPNKCIGCGECASCKQDAHSMLPVHTLDHRLCIGCGTCAELCPTGALELVGKDYTVWDVFAKIERDKAFYGERGGVTVSGGEPFLQAEEVTALFKLCKENGIHTAAETCGYFDPKALNEIVPLCDLFLWDVKDTCPQRHKVYTGVSNERIVSNLLLADSMGAHTRLRCILINNINTEEAHDKGIAELYHRLKNCEGVELIPYHSFGGAKSVALGKANSGNDRWIPSKEQVSDTKKNLQQRGVPVF